MYVYIFIAAHGCISPLGINNKLCIYIQAYLEYHDIITTFHIMEFKL